MTETLYRLHPAKGTHCCENKDNEGWLKGSTLDDETNQVHGTADLEPVDVDPDSLEEGIAIGLAVSAIAFCVFEVWVNRDAIAEWTNNRIVNPIKTRWNKLTNRRVDVQEEAEKDNILDIREYLTDDEDSTDLYDSVSSR